MPPPPTWFDNTETYLFFRNDFFYSNKKVMPSLHSTSTVSKPYVITPDIVEFKKRKERIDLLAPFYGFEYSQKLLYMHLTLDRFLRLGMPINRTSLLLNDASYYFEKFLYLDLNWIKGKTGFYRDHFFHIANEAYMGFKLLKNAATLEEKMITFLKGNNLITRYIHDCCRVDSSDEVLRYIIYRCWFLSSLFHDLGYVLNYYRSVRENIFAFHRHSDLIFRAERSSFGDIQLSIGNSMLFNTVDHETLEKAYNGHKHGVLSAFLMLCTYYSTPAFDGIDSIDRVAIELAARSIFFHDFPDEEDPEFIQKIEGNNDKSEKGKEPWWRYSEFALYESCPQKIEKFIIEKIGIKINFGNTYKISFPDEVKKSEREGFNKDPFSFLLRFIDELQAFGRNYLCFDSKLKQPIKKGKKFTETPFSYSGSHMRNLVRFPAQIIEYKEENKLAVYYVADASVLMKKQGKTNNPLFDQSNRQWDESAVKFFFSELFWLRKSAIDSGIFDDIELYFVEVWPTL